MHFEDLLLIGGLLMVITLFRATQPMPMFTLQPRPQARLLLALLLTRDDAAVSAARRTRTGHGVVLVCTGGHPRLM